MVNISIGIDPGVNGAVVIIVDNKIMEALVVPKDKNGKVDYKALDYQWKRLIKTYDLLNRENNVHVAIEDIHAYPGSAAEGTFNFGGITKVLNFILITNQLSYTPVTPRDWQKQMWQGVPEIRKSLNKQQLKKNQEAEEKEKLTGKKQNRARPAIDTKAMSLVAAKRLFPNLNLRDPNAPKSKKEHDGIVDALLIAEYCRRNFL